MNIPMTSGLHRLHFPRGRACRLPSGAEKARSSPPFPLLPAAAFLTFPPANHLSPCRLPGSQARLPLPLILHMT